MAVVPPSGGSSAVPSLPPPCPKSPPEYPDLYGKRRETAKVQLLEREIGFLEEEIKSVQALQPASKCCKEVADFVVARSDPLIPSHRKHPRSCRFWKWLCGLPCFSLSWICCCCYSQCSCHVKCPRCSDCVKCPKCLQCPKCLHWPKCPKSTKCPRCCDCDCNCNCGCDCNMCSCKSCFRCPRVKCGWPQWCCSCSCACPRPHLRLHLPSCCCRNISCSWKCCSCRLPSCPDCCSCCRWERSCPKCPKPKVRSCCSCKQLCCNPCCLFF